METIGDWRQQQFTIDIGNPLVDGMPALLNCPRRNEQRLIPGSIKATKIFWGRLAGTGGVWAAERLFSSNDPASGEAKASKK
jgi:hypothetical protein